MIAVYISATQFSVAGNLTGEFTTGRRIKANCGVDGYKYSTIQSSSYSSNTTVTITESVLTSNLSDVLYGIVNIGVEGSFPDHTHDGTEGQGGSLSYITESEFTTYSGTMQTQITTLSGTMQMQIDGKPDAFIELSDAPSIYSNGLFAKSTDSGIVWAPVSSGTSDVQSLLDLIDTPTTYSGHVGELLRTTASGIEFIDSGIIIDASGLFELDEYGGLMPTSTSGLGSSTVVSIKEDLSGGLITETWSKNTGDLFPNFMDDTYMTEIAPTTNYNTETTVSFNRSISDWEYDRNALFKFYIKDCIGTKNITSAIFKIYCTDASFVGNSLYRVLKNWEPAEVTWNNYKTGSTWTAGGGLSGTSFPVDDSSSADYYSVPVCTLSAPTLNTWSTMNITSIVQAWSTNTHNEYGIIIIGSESTALAAAHSNEGTDGFRPTLEISYYADAKVDVDEFVDGQMAVTVDEYYNKYTLNKSLAKWIVNDGNKYTLTSDLPTDSAFIINIGTRVYDVEVSSWKEWDGDSWETVSMVGTFLDLTDTPNTYSDGLYAKSTTSGIVWATVSGGTSSVQSFLDLTDTPNTYSGTEGLFAQSTGSGIVWTSTIEALSGDRSPIASDGVVNDLFFDSLNNDVYKKIFDVGIFDSIYYWRLYISVCNDTAYCEIATFELRSSIGGTDQAYGSGGTATANSTWSGYGPSNAFDNNDSTFWITTDVDPCWIQYQVTAPIEVVEIYLRPRSGYTTYMPKDFTLQYSTNGNDWVNVKSWVNENAWPEEGKTFLTDLSYDTTGWDVILDAKNTFIDLTDTPTTYSGTEGMFAQSTGSGIIWSTVSGSGSSDPPTSGVWNFEEATLSGTGDIYCGDLYIGDLKISKDDATLVVEKVDLDLHGVDEYTTLMLHMDGENNSTVFTDSSASEHVMTATGNAKISTALSKFGSASALLDGNDSITSPESADFDFGTNPFTIDFWVRLTEILSYNYFFDIGSDNSCMYLSGSVWSVRNPVGTILVSATATPVLDAWTHVAITRSGNTWNIFINGLLSGTASSSAVFGASNKILCLGNYGGGGNYGIKGYLEEFRISKGIVRWTEDFTVPNAAYYSSSSPFLKELSYTDHTHTFLDLTDTPNTYSDGLYAKSTTSGIEWATVSGGTSNSDHGTLTGLSDDDHPQYIRHDLAIAENDFLVGAPLPFGTFNKKSLNETRELLGVTGSGIVLSQTFLDLTDTPNTYSDGLYAKSTTSGIEWATVSGGTSNIQTFLDLTDTPNEYSSGKFAQSTSDGIIWTTVSGGTGASYGELELSYSSNIVLDFTTYNLQSIILTGNTNFTFTNMTNAKPCILNVIQDAQGSRSATFQSNVKWPQGVIPTTSSGSGLNDIFTFVQSRGTIYGDCVKAFQLGS